MKSGRKNSVVKDSRSDTAFYFSLKGGEEFVSYLVCLKTNVSVLVEDVTDVVRYENFVDFYNKDVLVASFNDENLSHFLQVEEETVETFKNPIFRELGVTLK